MAGSNLTYSTTHECWAALVAQHRIIEDAVRRQQTLLQEGVLLLIRDEQGQLPSALERIIRDIEQIEIEGRPPSIESLAKIREDAERALQWRGFGQKLHVVPGEPKS